VNTKDTREVTISHLGRTLIVAVEHDPESGTPSEYEEMPEVILFPEGEAPRAIAEIEDNPGAAKLAGDKLRAGMGHKGPDGARYFGVHRDYRNSGRLRLCMAKGIHALAGLVKWHSELLGGAHNEQLRERSMETVEQWQRFLEGNAWKFTITEEDGTRHVYEGLFCTLEEAAQEAAETALELAEQVSSRYVENLI
jgi:hypothetical protein